MSHYKVQLICVPRDPGKTGHRTKTGCRIEEKAVTENREQRAGGGCRRKNGQRRKTQREHSKEVKKYVAMLHVLW